MNIKKLWTVIGALALIFGLLFGFSAYQENLVTGAELEKEMVFAEQKQSRTLDEFNSNIQQQFLLQKYKVVQEELEQYKIIQKALPDDPKVKSNIEKWEKRKEDIEKRVFK